MKRQAADLGSMTQEVEQLRVRAAHATTLEATLKDNEEKMGTLETQYREEQVSKERDIEDVEHWFLSGTLSVYIHTGVEKEVLEHDGRYEGENSCLLSLSSHGAVSSEQCNSISMNHQTG